MNHVERFRAVMNFQPVDRLPIIEWAPWWDQTFARWHTESLPAELTDGSDSLEYFGLDYYQRLVVPPRGPHTPEPASHGAGIITNAHDYERIKPTLYPEPAAAREQLERLARQHRKGSTVIWMAPEGFFWFPRTLFGIERHLLAFYDQPDLMHRMNHDLTAFTIRAINETCRYFTPDFMTFGEDMSYNHGPMLSEEMFNEFLAPYYLQIVPLLKERGILPTVDSDGDIMPLIPWLKNVGIEGILPLERMAGVDVVELRRRHPRWRLIGAFDKTVMKHGESAMRTEFERLLPVMKQGGFIPSVDHQTPPDVSLQNYRVYVALLREYCEKAALH